MTTEQIEKLGKLKELLDSEIINQEEFSKEKEKILSQSSQLPESLTETQHAAQTSGLTSEEDKPSVGLNILCFLTGIIGVIIYFATREKYPIRAKSNLKWALIGIVVSVGFTIIMSVISEMLY